jgi:hypothetical protein
MFAIGADIQIVGQFPVKQHCAALITLGPKIVRHFPA